MRNFRKKSKPFLTDQRILSCICTKLDLTLYSLPQEHQHLQFLHQKKDTHLYNVTLQSDNHHISKIQMQKAHIHGKAKDALEPP